VTAQRLDEALVARGLVQSRARGRDAVLRGIVRVNGAEARKPSQNIAAADVLTLSDESARYVSRAALKLIHSFEVFDIDPKGKSCVDLGASTGGFTQVLLEAGATHVTAIDVGHGQMVPHLAQDPRVTLREGLNARDITAADIPADVSLVVSDVSFISLKLALPPVLSLVAENTTLITLIKPQFEVGRAALGKGGVVRDEALLTATCAGTASFINGLGWRVLGLVPSPIEGGDGNREFLLAACKP
jgi:23S rRNA (cytidine1920-2'-O)/16S rRNA (cytidine1409-2'-O)-methyltransferase